MTLSRRGHSLAIIDAAGDPGVEAVRTADEVGHEAHAVLPHRRDAVGCSAVTRKHR